MEDIEILADIIDSGDELQGVDNDLANLLALLRSPCPPPSCSPPRLGKHCMWKYVKYLDFRSGCR